MRRPDLATLPAPPAGQTGWPWTEAPAPAAPAGAVRWPRITLVTPSFNQAAYLEETLRSVLLQGYPDLEYFVIDGGSTDGSVDIIRRYAPWLAGWVSEPDRGPADALNKGFARATGRLRAYLNSDDVYEPGALAAAGAAYADGHPWICGGVRYVEAGRKPWPVPQLAGRRAADWFVTCPVSQAGCFWSADLQAAAGPFREDLHFFFDYDLWMRFRFGSGVVPWRIDAPLARYRLHPASKTVAEQHRFDPERRAIRAAVLGHLPPAVRAHVWAVQSHWRAHARWARAVALWQQGQRLAGAAAWCRAVASWPLVVPDRLLVGPLRAARAGRPDGGPGPSVFPDELG